MHIEVTIVVIIMAALLIGALTRVASSKWKIPFTVAMLLLGLGMGWALHRWAPHEPEHFEHGYALHDVLWMFARGTGMAPNLIIFVFLPALLFESAFGLDVHAFRKSIGAVAVLAVPALLVATGLTAGLMQALVPDAWGWDWTTALIFGALISATDPVAVVALMRDLGVSKRLATLIEGESLMNDGTAIVIFTVLLAMLEDKSAAFVLGPTLVKFAIVVTGGLAIGLVLSLVHAWWLGKTFNDPLVEISLTLTLCYSAMFIAEGMLHVSGVMAVVLAGLWMSGPGKTKITPSVMHFLHQFWEMLAYIANTLIFLLVGLVIGAEAGGATLGDLGLIVAAYAGIMVIRAAVTFAFRPIANLAIKDKISVPDAVVASWGGLRGAVSIALVLIITSNESVPRPIRTKLLLITAGVVLLSIIVNGTTMGALLRHFGYDKLPPAQELASVTTRMHVLDHVHHGIHDLSSSKALRTVRWNDVEEGIAERKASLEREAAGIRTSLQSASAAERASGFWIQVLRMERGAYWKAYGQGTLGEAAVQALDHEIDLQLDRVSRGDNTPPETRMPQVGGFTAWFRENVRSKLPGSAEMDDLALTYDLTRGESYAAGVVLEQMEEISGIDEAATAVIATTYRGYLAAGKERLEEMRVHLPELTQAIENRIAHRLALNLERDEYDHLGHDGVIEHGAAVRLAAEVDERIQRLASEHQMMPLPETHELLRDVPLFAPLDAKSLQSLASDATSEVVTKGEFLCRQGESGDSLFVIARGAVHVLISIDGSDDLMVDVMGGGDVVGEMSLLTGEPRTASLKAATPVTVIEIDRAAFAKQMAASANLEGEIWDAFAQRRGDNLMRKLPAFRHLDRDTRVGWVSGAEHVKLAKGEAHDVGSGTARVLVVTGAVVSDSGRHPAPNLIDTATARRLEADGDARIVLLPPPPAG